MERLIELGKVDAVLDVNLSEIINTMIPNSIVKSSLHRLETAGRLGIPQVVSLGALDALTIGSGSPIPDEYCARKMIVVNAKFTLVRISSDECLRVGELIAKKLIASRGPVTLIIPRKGLSLLSQPGGLFEDSVANECLFEAIRSRIDPKVVCLIERDEHINEPQFAAALVDALLAQLNNKLTMIQSKKELVD